MTNQTASSPTAITTNTFTRTGYTFFGWSDDGGDIYTDGQLYHFSQNITLNASWTQYFPPSHTITFINYDGYVLYQTASTSTAITTNTFTRTGYTFSGWTNVLDGAFYTDGQSYSFLNNMTLMAEWTLIPSNPTCFNKDTQILCLDTITKQDKYMLIQDLRKGDLVKTYKHGYKAIEGIGYRTMINNPDKWDSCMYKMKKTDTMTSDLILTGGHSILLNGMPENIMKIQSHLNRGPIAKIDDKYLLLAFLSESFEKVMDTEEYTYYHLYLESGGDKTKRYGICSNGIMTETTCELSFLRNNYTII